MRTTGNTECCYIPQIPQPSITPSEGSRINSQLATFTGILLNGGGVSQERVKQLLANPQNPGSEGVRISLLEQATIAASTESPFYSPIVLTQCPPLPAPPAPPARACPLPKNMRIGS